MRRHQQGRDYSIRARSMPIPPLIPMPVGLVGDEDGVYSTGEELFCLLHAKWSKMREDIGRKNISVE